MALECHLVEASSSTRHELSPLTPAAGEHSGCGGNKTAGVETADVADSLPACEHCQTSCHTSHWFVTFSGAESIAPVAQMPSFYALPLPQSVFIDSPQRPPQAV